MQRLVVAIACAAWLTGCESGVGASTDAGTSTEATTSTATPTSTTGTSADAPTTTGDSTGEPAMCPQIEPIAEDEFAARFAEAICAQKEACGCGGEFACVGAVKLQFEAVQQYAADKSLRFEPECAQELLASAVLHRGCRRESDFYGPLGECGWGCAVFRGDVPTGGACENADADFYAYSNMCAAEGEYCQLLEDLTCDTSNLTPLAPGEACMTADYASLGVCGDGHRCSSESRVCVPQVGEGEACGDFAVCIAGLLCEAGVCEPRRDSGAACESDAQCLSSACDAGACRDEPVICLVDSPSDLLYNFTL